LQSPGLSKAIAQALHLSPLATGLLLLPGGLIMGLLGPVVGRLYDRVGARALLVPGTVVTSLALWWSTLFDTASPAWSVLGFHGSVSTVPRPAVDRAVPALAPFASFPGFRWRPGRPAALSHSPRRAGRSRSSDGPSRADWPGYG